MKAMTQLEMDVNNVNLIFKFRSKHFKYIILHGFVCEQSPSLITIVQARFGLLFGLFLVISVQPTLTYYTCRKYITMGDINCTL